MKNIKLVVEYDGTDYHGWQIQPNGITLQEVLESCLSQLAKEKIKVIASGRTDAGVHARGQVVNFKTKLTLKPSQLLKGLNRLLPSDIVVKQAEEVKINFHARRQAKSKLYRYFILNRNYPSSFDYKYSWYIPDHLDLDLISEAAKYIIGEHDFSSFQSSGTNNQNPRRDLIRLDIERKEDRIIFDLEGNGFLKYMVRNIVGTLVEVGREKINPLRIKKILEGASRPLAGPTAPARGLFLIKVRY